VPDNYSTHNIVKNCYKSISRFSTSSEHNVAHKLMVEWLLERKHGRGEVATVGAEILFKNGFRADIVSYWRNDEVWSEVIEVCNPLGYLHTVRYRGRKEFGGLVRTLQNRSVIDERQARNIRRKRPSGRNNGYIHFYADVVPAGLKFARKIDNPCELKRKSDKWDGQTAELSFLVPEHELRKFEWDVKSCGLEVSHLYVVDADAVVAVRNENSYWQVHKGSSPLKKPDYLEGRELIWEKEL
jgi:hypothetical protein